MRFVGLQERKDGVSKRDVDNMFCLFVFSISWGYSKVFQEYSRSISQLYPNIQIEGGNYPPKLLNKSVSEVHFRCCLLLLMYTGHLWSEGRGFTNMGGNIQI